MVCPVTSPTRSAAMPEVPIVAEAGVVGVDVENWYALLAPAGTPADRINQLWEISRATLNRPDIARLFTEQGGRMVVSGPSDSAAFIRAEVEKWAEVVRLGGLRAD